MGEEKQMEMNKCQPEAPVPSPSFSSYSDGFIYDQNDEKLEYGPGIVDKLRSKFLNLMVREKDEQFSQPVRRASSLEELLKSDTLATLFHHYESKISGGSGFKTQLKKCRLPVRRKYDVLKKARSMETLLNDGLAGDEPKQAVNKTVLVNENVVIIERGNRVKRSGVGGVGGGIGIGGGAGGEEVGDIGTTWQGKKNIDLEEMPKPDTVSTYMKLFENGLTNENKKTKRLKLKGIAAKMAKNSSQAEPTNNLPKVSWIEEATAHGLLKSISSSNEDKVVCREFKKGFTITTTESRTKKVVDNPEKNCEKLLKKPIVENHSTPAASDFRVAVAVAGKVENETAEKEEKSSAKKVVEVVDEVKKEEDEVVMGKSELITDKVITPSATVRPRVVNLKSKPAVEEKPVGLIRPLPICTSSSDSQENAINKAQSIGNGLNGSDNNSLVLPLQRLRKTVPVATDAKNNTVVFDFTRNPEITPNISNYQNRYSPIRPMVRIDKVSGKVISNVHGVDGSGIVLIPGLHVTYSQDFSDDDEDDVTDSVVYPSGIIFEGENVIIGKSCLLKNRNKQLKTTFYENATKVYEYPAEHVVLDADLAADRDSIPADDVAIAKDDQQLPLEVPTPPSSDRLSNPNSVSISPGGGLGNYVPSKLSEEEVFELGVSRSTPASGTGFGSGSDLVPSTNKVSVSPPAPSDPLETTTLTPADDNEASSWSSSQTIETTDLLF